MKSTVLNGILIWLVPFAIGSALISVIDVESALFDTLMAIILTAATCYLSYRYNRRKGAVAMGSALQTGIIWMIIAWLLDAPFFLIMDFAKMPLGEYIADIGLAYLMIPIINLTVATAMQGRR